MGKLAIYRKYRPSTFADILGQEIIVKILKEAAKQNKLTHAYLFSGPRGTGKTTTARLIAKIANCEKRRQDEKIRKAGEPCNQCKTCREIDAGLHLDVIEIDAASNRGIDEIRDLKENIRVFPHSAPYKIFIIDEAHMLTKHAFNALLKTLEDPPPYVIIILATTEKEKIPPTIISRTQQFHFKKAPIGQIIKKLTEISKKERIKISPQAIGLIASVAEGSFRDAESLLDQLIAADLEKIELTDVERIIGKIGFHKLSEFSELLLKGDLKSVLDKIAEINDKGYDLTQFTKDLIHYLRRVAVLKFNPEMKSVFANELTIDQLEKISAQAAIFKNEHLDLIKRLIEAYTQMRYSHFPIIPLEVVIVESLNK